MRPYTYTKYMHSKEMETAMNKNGYVIRLERKEEYREVEAINVFQLFL